MFVINHDGFFEDEHCNLVPVNAHKVYMKYVPGFQQMIASVQPKFSEPQEPPSIHRKRFARDTLDFSSSIPLGYFAAQERKPKRVCKS